MDILPNEVLGRVLAQAGAWGSHGGQATPAVVCHKWERALREAMQDGEMLADFLLSSTAGDDVKALSKALSLGNEKAAEHLFARGARPNTHGLNLAAIHLACPASLLARAMQLARPSDLAGQVSIIMFVPMMWVGEDGQARMYMVSQQVLQIPELFASAVVATQGMDKLAAIVRASRLEELPAMLLFSVEHFRADIVPVILEAGSKGPWDAHVLYRALALAASMGLHKAVMPLARASKVAKGGRDEEVICQYRMLPLAALADDTPTVREVLLHVPTTQVERQVTACYLARCGNARLLALMAEQEGVTLGKPLLAAARAGQTAIVRQIIAMQPNGVLADDWVSAAMLASAGGHVDALRALLTARPPDHEVTQAMLEQLNARTAAHEYIPRGGALLLPPPPPALM